MRRTGKNLNLLITSQREFNKAFISSSYTYVPFLRRDPMPVRFMFQVLYKMNLLF